MLRLGQPFPLSNKSRSNTILTNVQYIKWEIQAIVASITEVAIFAAPVWLVWQLQKNLKVKLEIVIWFGSRLLCVSLSSESQKATRMLSIRADEL